MPLPISSQTYIHNPAVEVSAFEAGRRAGSPLTNIVQGAMEGFGFVTDQKDKLQKIEMRPREQARLERQTDISQQQADLAQTREQRLAANQEFEHDYKRDTLDLRQSELDFKKDSFNKRFSLQKANANIKARQAAMESYTTGAMNDMIIHGKPDSMLAALKEPRAIGEFTKQVIADPERGQALIESIEDGIADGKYDAETVQRLDSFIQTVEYGKKLSSARERADRYVPIMSSIIGAVPEDNGYLQVVKREDGGMSIFQQTPEMLGRDAFSRALGGRHILAEVDDTSNPKEVQSIMQAVSAHNQKVRYNMAIQKAIKANAEMKAKRQQADVQQPQQEEPVKEARARKSRPEERNFTVRGGAPARKKPIKVTGDVEPEIPFYPQAKEGDRLMTPQQRDARNRAIQKEQARTQASRRQRALAGNRA